MMRALVLGGGGVTGVAWETGLLYGLEQEGLRLRDADRLVGTSAGSVVSAQVAGSTPLQELYRRQVEGASTEIPGSLGFRGTVQLVVDLMLAIDKEAGLRRLGRKAVRATDPAMVGQRRGVIEQRLPQHEWPDRDLRITAVDVESGALRVFDPASGVGLVDAVSASCAVPLVWPVVEIDGRLYMDGGMWSGTNVQLAKGCDRIVVIAPENIGLTKDLRALGQGVRTAIITPDADAKVARGRNSLDPAARRPSAEAGLAQAHRVAEQVRAVWDA
ncbi:patatin-like phospholipase family protein [Microbacterium sp. ASV49]|uniref:Patatin-like phospholipase family protein n=1 Tax=Microbacterium candidum TaxID=3041922 RepID=A0ABT7MV38_9MICO|nr:patatin-like phospholipase family protein [Microbacterium sp. ASV49]MDL9978321.1 patatin-like phospholipase family protein [Microbacterium sp. ASV49]